MKHDQNSSGEKKTPRAAALTAVFIVLCLLAAGGVFVLSKRSSSETSTLQNTGPVSSEHSAQDSSGGSFFSRAYKWLGIDTVLSILRHEDMDRDEYTDLLSEASRTADTAVSAGNAANDSTDPTGAAQPAGNDTTETVQTSGTDTASTAQAAGTAAAENAGTNTGRATETAGSGNLQTTGTAPAENPGTNADKSAETAGTGSSKAAGADTAGTGNGKANAADTADTGKAAETAGNAQKEAAKDKAEEEKDDSPTKLQKKYIKAWEDWHMRDFPENFPLHNYNWKYLEYDEKGILHYEGDDNYMIRRGIDVSEFQGSIDWEKVKEAGFDFVFVRVGHRTMHTGDLQRDNRAIKNLKRAKKAGLDVGAYIFSQAITKDEAREEAQLCLDVIKESGVELTLPIVFDPEIVVEDYYARINFISGEQFTDNCIAFCKKIQKAGYTPAVYANCSTETDILDMSRLDQDTVIWYADYSGTPDSPYDFTFWQYSNLGRVDGIPETETDLNVWFIKK